MVDDGRAEYREKEDNVNGADDGRTTTDEGRTKDGRTGGARLVQIFDSLPSGLAKPNQ